MKLYENRKLSDERVREYLGQKALFFSVLAGYSRTPNTNRVEFDEQQLKALENAKKALDIHLTILNTPLDDYSANPEQRDADREHQSGVDVDRVDFYRNSMGTISTAINKDEDEEPGYDGEDAFTDETEGLVVNEIYSYSDAASKLRRDMIAASGLLTQALQEKSLTVSGLNRLYSLFSGIKANSFVERDILGYDPFYDTAIRTSRGAIPVRDDPTRDAVQSFMEMAGRILEPTEGVSILAQQGLGIVLGNNFYNDLMSADILDKGKYNTFKNGLESNLVSRVEKNAVNDGDVFADLMIRNSRRLERAAWDQYQAVKEMFGEAEGMTMLANIQVVYQKTLAKIARTLPSLEKDIAQRQAALRTMADQIGMEENVDYSLSPDINLSTEDIDSFLARNDLLENIDPDIENHPEFIEQVKNYNAAYLKFAEKKKLLYDTLSFLVDPVNANAVASLQNLIPSANDKVEFIKVLNENPHIQPPSLYNAYELAALRSKYINDVSTSVRMYRSEEEMAVKPRSQQELAVLNEVRKIEDRIADENNGGRLMDLISSIGRKEIAREFADFISQDEIAPFFRDVDPSDITDYYMLMAGEVEKLSDEFYDAGEELARAGSQLNAEIRKSLAHAQVEFLSQLADFNDKEKAELQKKFSDDAVFATIQRNLHKDRVFSSTDEEVSVVHDLRAEYGNTISLVYGSAAPMGIKDACRVIEKDTLSDASPLLQSLAENMKYLSIDKASGQVLSEAEASAAKENLEKDGIRYYENALKEAEKDVSESGQRLASYMARRDEIRSFSPDVQISHGYEVKKLFDDFVVGKNREENFNRIQTLLQGIVRNNPDEEENVKKISAYCIREAVADGSANQLVSEMVDKGLLGDDANYSLKDVQGLVDTLMIAGEDNKKILAKYRQTGDYTRLKRIKNPDREDKAHFENKIVATYNGFYQEDRLEELNRQIGRAQDENYTARNKRDYIRSFSPRAYAYSDIATAAIAKGTVDDARVQYFKERTREFENMMLRDKGYNTLRNVSNIQYEKEDQYIKNAQDFYNDVIETVGKCENLSPEERTAVLKGTIFKRNEDYAHPVQELFRREVNSKGKYRMTAQEVAIISPESSQQRYSLSVLPSESFDMSAFKTTLKSKERGSMEDFLNIRNLYAEVKSQSIYTYPVNKGIDTLYNIGLESRNARRSVAESERAMTEYGKHLRDARAAGKSFNQDLRTFAIKNLPPTEEYINGLKKVLINRGVRADLVESMKFVPSSKTNNTVVNISSDVLSKCSKADQLKFRSTITDIYIKEKVDGVAPGIKVVGNEMAKKRIIGAISRNYNEQSKAPKRTRTLERTRSAGMAF